jgi:hypothetical protein
VYTHLRELDQKPCDEKTKKALEQISDHVLMTEFDSALKIVEELVLQTIWILICRK